MKETDLTYVKPGQKAQVVLDIYPDVTWAAEVDSISPATGAEFAILPPQNASGNWVKVVQRLPVRVRLSAAPGRATAARRHDRDRDDRHRSPTQPCEPAARQRQRRQPGVRSRSNYPAGRAQQSPHEGHMTGLASQVDVAVIGAGAAGIAAARRLVAAGGVSVLVLEARERAGGRAWTVEAGRASRWISAASGCIRPTATRSRRSPNSLASRSTSGGPIGRRDCATAAKAQGPRPIGSASARRITGRSTAPRRSPRIRPASSVLVPGGRWNALFDATSTWANAVELEQLSVKDNDRYEDSGINWRLRDGYGRLFEALAEGLPIAYGTAGDADRHRGATLRSKPAAAR